MAERWRKSEIGGISSSAISDNPVDITRAYMPLGYNYWEISLSPEYKRAKIHTLLL